MISEQQLDQFRVDGSRIRVVRDAHESNDVVGIVVAWDAESVVIRKANRRVVKVSRSYVIEPAEQPRSNVLQHSEQDSLQDT
ncbi:hypothetical protein PAECIP111893_03945 [Paenibacillus plantiphilus]|uniref:Uncharacterized protein n=1 Tax=Paenibacillus plantiphilus TaxID=2905650 RepID=A0ABM9CK93_9BACL|nr:hypothetical protein [Paenibacillus plantiphilus]CAH1215388.1 hypothetical protein PAECIP111893_03945 [Paenibacillus plantiphilus]